MVKDLVCGMNIDESTAATKTQYKGTTYYFCAHGCLRAFLSEPEKYLNVGSDSNPNVVREFNSRTKTFSTVQLSKNKLL